MIKTIPMLRMRKGFLIKLHHRYGNTSGTRAEGFWRVVGRASSRAVGASGERLAETLAPPDEDFAPEDFFAMRAD